MSANKDVSSFFPFVGMRPLQPRQVTGRTDGRTLCLLVRSRLCALPPNQEAHRAEVREGPLVWSPSHSASS